MLEVVISGIHRADEDDIWGNEITHRPEKTFDPIVVEGKRIKAITLPAFTYIHEGIITPDVPNHMVRDASVRLSPTLAIVSRAALDAHNAEVARLQAELATLYQQLADATVEYTGRPVDRSVSHE